MCYFQRPTRIVKPHLTHPYNNPYNSPELILSHTRDGTWCRNTKNIKNATWIHSILVLYRIYHVWYFVILVIKWPNMTQVYFEYPQKPLKSKFRTGTSVVILSMVLGEHAHEQSWPNSSTVPPLIIPKYWDLEVFVYKKRLAKIFNRTKNGRFSL